MKVKMCGLRRLEDIQYANQVKPDYVGFVFAESFRKIEMEQAAQLRRRLSPDIQAVGVFVNETPERIAEIADTVSLDAVQLHGDEELEDIFKLRKQMKQKIWKAVRVESIQDIVKAEKFPVDMLLLDSFCKDAYGGTGKVLNLSLIKRQKIKLPYFLAGGLNPDNLEGILQELLPDGIDLSSGIETGGKKDLNKMKKIIEICRRRL